MPCQEKIALKSYLTPEEYKTVATKAAQAKLSISSFVKKVCLAQEIQSKIDHDSVLALIQATADLGRLGGLLKKGLSEHPNFDALRVLLKSVEQSKTVLKKRFEDVVWRLID